MMHELLPRIYRDCTTSLVRMIHLTLNHLHKSYFKIQVKTLPYFFYIIVNFIGANTFALLVGITYQVGLCLHIHIQCTLINISSLYFGKFN